MILSTKNGTEGVSEGPVQVETKHIFAGSEMEQPPRVRCDNGWMSRCQCGEMTLRLKCKCSFNSPNSLETHIDMQTHTHTHTSIVYTYIYAYLNTR